ncbi:hypothetical protein ACTWPT_06000 [Nonomuraea sp. 3N208]
MSSKRLDPCNWASWRPFGIGLLLDERRRSPQARIPDYNALVTVRSR